MLSIAVCASAADEQWQYCAPLQSVYSYSAGVQAQKEGYDVAAFDIFCNLAVRGDYRSQYKLAQYYLSGIENYLQPNKNYAYVWAKISNSYVLSRNRQRLVDEIAAGISREEQEKQNNLLYAAVLRSIPAGTRLAIDSAADDYKRLLREERVVSNGDDRQTANLDSVFLN